MAKFNYWRELHKARLEAEWVFRNRQIDLLKEQLKLESDCLWTDELASAIACAERIGRKLDQMADENSMEPKLSDSDDIYRPYKWVDANGNEHIRTAYGCCTIMKDNDKNDIKQ